MNEMCINSEMSCLDSPKTNLKVVRISLLPSMGEEAASN